MSNTFCIPDISSAKEIKDLVQNFAYRAGSHRRNGATSNITELAVCISLAYSSGEGGDLLIARG